MIKRHRTFAACGVLLSLVAGGVWAAESVTRAATGRTATRLDPITVSVVPAATQPAGETISADTIAVSPDEQAAIARVGRPPIVQTRSQIRPSPLPPVTP